MDGDNSTLENFYSFLCTPDIHSDIEVKITKINFGVSEMHPDLKKAIVVDCCNHTYIGRFTTWDDNSCIAEILDINTEKNRLLERYDFENVSELQSHYLYFLDHILIL